MFQNVQRQLQTRANKRLKNQNEKKIGDILKTGRPPAHCPCPGIVIGIERDQDI